MARCRRSVVCRWILVHCSIAPTFSNLTLIQQRLAGRTGETTANLTVMAHCGRRSGSSRGPGDDWFCTVDALIAQPGAVPFWGTPVTYDIGKCDLRGQGLLRVAKGGREAHEVVNP